MCEDTRCGAGAVDDDSAEPRCVHRFQGKRDALLFTGPKGGPLRRSTFNPLVGWKQPTAAIGVPGLTFHDLRHTGATLAAQTGASLRDLMQRIGHDSTAAAIRYQHASREADQVIAATLDEAIDAARKDDEGDDGAAGALVPAGT